VVAFREGINSARVQVVSGDEELARGPLAMFNNHLELF